MDKRLLEKIYDAYLEEIENPVEEHNEEINKVLEEKIMNMFKQPLKEKAIEKENRNIEFGNVYVMFMEDIPVYYMIYEEVDENLFEVLKITNYWELSSNIDLITKINDELFAIETWNFFYLTEKEIRNFIYYGKIKEDDYMLIKAFKEGNIKELPQNRRGLTPISDDSIQAKFKEKEAELVRAYAFRLLKELFEEPIILNIAPEKEEELLMAFAASTEKTIIRSDLFLLRKDKEQNMIEIILNPDIVGKCIKIEYFGDNIEIENAPERYYIKLTNNLDIIDLEKLLQHIKVTLC